MILMVVRAPTNDAAFAQVATVTGLAAADVRRKLAGILPRVLLLDTDDQKLASIQGQLKQLGFVCALVDPDTVPGDDARIVARTLSMGPAEIVVHEGTGSETPHSLPLGAIELLQRGVRVAGESKTSTTTERKFALGRAVLSGGLVTSKKVEKTETTKVEAREPFVVMHRNDGGRDVILYEKRLNYRFLGPEMQPASFGNLELTFKKIRALVPATAFDDRVTKPGFVTALPATRAQPVDLALHMVRMARRYEG